MQAGPFGGNEPAAAARGDEGEDGDDSNGGISLRPGDVVEISSENTGQGSHSGGAWSGMEAGHEDAGDNKRRKSYHRHSAEQIRVMEA